MHDISYQGAEGEGVGALKWGREKKTQGWLDSGGHHKYIYIYIYIYIYLSENMRFL